MFAIKAPGSKTLLLGNASKSKKYALLLFCFCIGALLTALLIRLVSFSNATQTKAKEQINILEKKQLISAMNLVNVELPPPPEKPAIEAPHAKVSKAINIKTVSRSKRSVKTDQPKIQAIGLALLKKADQQNSPDIQIALPQNPGHQIKVIQVLRQCLGVRLGKIGASGKILAREQNKSLFSPYIRLVEGRLTQQEQNIVNQWRQLPGSIVRFYPELADAGVLGGLYQLVNGEIENTKITGEYSLENGGLKLINITINDQVKTAELVIAQTCQV